MLTKKKFRWYYYLQKKVKKLHIFMHFFTFTAKDVEGNLK